MADERARLFVALDLPEAVREALTGWQSRVPPERGGLRPVAPESLHVTLCFLGWQPASQAGPIATVVRGAVAGLPAPRLSIGDTVWLPRRRPRVLAIELRDAQGELSQPQGELSQPQGELSQLQAALSGQLSAGGWYQPEQRRFLPHVTVARVRRSAQLASGAVAVGTLGDPPDIAFHGTQVTLYRSRLLAGGARYEALASVALPAA